MNSATLAIFGSLGGLAAGFGLMRGFGGFAAAGGLLALLCAATLIGRAAFPEERRLERFLLGLLGSLALISTLGTAAYYLHRFDGAAAGIVLAAAPWLAFLAARRAKARMEHETAGVRKALPEDTLGAALFVLAAAADIAAMRWLSGAASEEAIRSPWEVVPPIYFFWIFLASLAWIAFAWRGRSLRAAVFGAALHLFTILSPALFVYPLGYGFDPFIHIEAEKLVAAHGVVTPKTPYYIGQYVLVTLASGILRIPIALADRWLVPLLTALFLPLSSAWMLRRGFGVDRRVASLAVLAVCFVPLASFVSTTPQGLANLFCAMVIVFGAAWLHRGAPAPWFLVLVAAAAAAAHPIAGIPAFCALGFFLVLRLRRSPHPAGTGFKAALLAGIFLATALALPLILAFSNGMRFAPIASLLRQPLGETLAAVELETPGVPTRFRPFLDFVELLVRNRAVLLGFLAAAGLWLLFKKTDTRRVAWASLALAAGLCLAAVLMASGVSVRNVIAYEQGSYPSRLFELAGFALLPLIFLGAAWLWRAAARSEAGPRLFLTLLAAGACAGFAYAAYPRVDDYRFHRGYSVSHQDLEAVRAIERDAGMASYIVLANQSVSAAALREFGFKTYFGDQFYYPIPTGAPLYQSYLAMAYDGPRRTTAEAAARSVGAERAYFVINEYWNAFGKIVEEAKKEADAAIPVGGGKLMIFRYDLPAR